MSEVKSEAKEVKGDASKVEKALVFWGPGGKERRDVTVPNPGLRVNGKLLLGKCNLTYDETGNAMSILSSRFQHEIRSRMGDSTAKTLFELNVAGSDRELY